LFWLGFDDLSDRSQKILLLTFTLAFQKLNPALPFGENNLLQKQLLITSGCLRLFRLFNEEEYLYLPEERLDKL